MMPKAKPSAMVDLWSINRWLRWTGIRLGIEVDLVNQGDAREPTRLGLVWWGWKDLFPPVPHQHWFDPSFDPNCSNCKASYPGRSAALGRGHCGHAPKCINEGEPDERDPLGCCNCGTRTAELPPAPGPLDAFARDLAACQAALPPVDDLAERQAERLLVQQRKHTQGDARRVRLAAKDAAQPGPAANPSLQPATERCLNPIKGEFSTWCKGCPFCGQVADKDSW